MKPKRSHKKNKNSSKFYQKLFFYKILNYSLPLPKFYPQLKSFWEKIKKKKRSIKKFITNRPLVKKTVNSKSYKLLKKFGQKWGKKLTKFLKPYQIVKMKKVKDKIRIEIVLSRQAFNLIILILLVLCFWAAYFSLQRMIEGYQGVEIWDIF